MQQPQRHADAVGELLAVLLDELRQDVVASDVHRSNPREVVEPSVTEAHLRGVDAEPAREQQLKSDRHIAEAHRAVPVVEQRAGDDSDRVGEVDDPGIRRGAAAHFVGDVEHDRNRAQRLGEASCACGLLADATAPQRNGLIEVPSGLTTDSQLQEHEVGAVDRLGRGRTLRSSSPSIHGGWRSVHSPRRPHRGGWSRDRTGRARRPRSRRAGERSHRPARACTCFRHRPQRSSWSHHGAVCLAR